MNARRHPFPTAKLDFIFQRININSVYTYFNFWYLYLETKVTLIETNVNLNINSFQKMWEYVSTVQNFLRFCFFHNAHLSHIKVKKKKEQTKSK